MSAKDGLTRYHNFGCTCGWSNDGMATDADGAWVRFADAAAALDALEAEVARLADWKESAISVTPPLQEIAKELRVPWGQSIHDKILPGIVALEAEVARMRPVFDAACAQLECHDVIMAHDRATSDSLEESSWDDALDMWQKSTVATEKAAQAAKGAKVSERIYFCYDPEAGGFDTFKTPEEARDAALKGIDASLDETWSEEVENICWGEVWQGATKENERQPDPDEATPGVDYICDYNLRPDGWEHRVNTSAELYRLGNDNARLTAELARLRGAAVPFVLSGVEKCAIGREHSPEENTFYAVLCDALRRCMNDLAFCQSQHAAACDRASEATMRAATAEASLAAELGLLGRAQGHAAEMSDYYQDLQDREEIERWLADYAALLAKHKEAGNG